MNSRKRQQGFSLIELLIVVAIILIIAAIAIPNLMHSRMAANESAAVGALRTIITGEITYYSSCPDTGYSSSLQELNIGANCAGGQGIIDEVLATGAKSGYVFNYAAAPDATTLINTYTLTAVPGSVGVTGQRGFYTDQTGVLHYDLDGSAPTSASSTLQ